MPADEPRGGRRRWFNRQPPVALTKHDIDAQIENSDLSRHLRRRLLPRALLVGLIAGGIAVAFRASLAFLESARTDWLSGAAMSTPLRFAASACLATLCATLSIWLVRRFSPAAAGSGIPQLKAVLLHMRAMNWLSLLLVKFSGGLLAIGGGLALGREGPTVQMGGAAGKMVGRLLGMTKAERFILIAAGAGAGLAAAFNAPLAGLVFVVEEIQRAFTSRVFFAALLASATADTVSRFAMGQQPVFHIESLPIPPLSLLPLFFILGLGAGLFGTVFNRAILASMDTFARLEHLPVLVPGLLVGLAVGAVACVDPALLGGGHALAEDALAGQLALGTLGLFFVLRFGLTLICYGSGAPAGIFAPLLVLGALGGLALGQIAQALYPLAIEHPQTFAVVGMAALFAAVVRAPLTGVVLIVEMTGEHSLMLPLMVACLTSYFIADMLGSRPLYASLMARDLEKQRQRLELRNQV
jgi:CIC family chloride channel protein